MEEGVGFRCGKVSHGFGLSARVVRPGWFLEVEIFRLDSSEVS